MTRRPFHLLALDASLALCSAALLVDGLVVAERVEPGERGQVQRLAPMLRAVLDAAPGALDAVAVGVGPGSFTGVRAALALAHGVALASGARLIGISVTEAFSASLPDLGGRALWVAIDGRRDRVFLDRGDGPVATPLDALPLPTGPIAVAGDAADAVAARLAAAGLDVMLTDAHQPLARDVARAALRRMAAGGAGGAVLPLYVDEPEAKLPAGGLRPTPMAVA